MKSRSEFTNEGGYREYLKLYFSAVALGSIAGELAKDIKRSPQENAIKSAELATLYADEVLKKLIPEKR